MIVVYRDQRNEGMNGFRSQLGILKTCTGQKICQIAETVLYLTNRLWIRRDIVSVQRGKIRGLVGDIGWE